jgi:hypothetical protein
MHRRSFSQGLAALLLIGLAANWRVVLWIVSVRLSTGLVLGAIWLALVIATVVGLGRVRRWGAYTLIVLAGFSTVAFSTPLFPGMHMVGFKGPIALTVWNLVALLSGIVILRTPHLSAALDTAAET